jgi:predicted oxidoreductase
MNVNPPVVDPDGFFFSANTLEELAAKIVMPQQRIPVSPAALAATVARYNSYVGATDNDFGKPSPQFRIDRGPFYAAWATPTLHDARSGLRINGKREVLDLSGKPIPGLYAGGEAAGGFSQHGMGRAMTDALIAMASAATRTA